MKSKVLVFPLQKKYTRHAEDVKRAGSACLFVLGKEDAEVDPSRLGRAEVDVYLIDEKRMRKLNKEFRGRDKSTNVLSFEEPKDFPRPGRRTGKKSAKLGEVYLAPDYIERKKGNIGRLVIHGILHLLGYTHGRLRDRMEMEKKEDKVLQKLEARNLKSETISKSKCSKFETREF